MSGLLRNVIDQVMRTMSEEERARSIDYVTDRMIERMDCAERTSLLIAIVDRVLSNLSPDERSAFAAALMAQVKDSTAGSTTSSARTVPAETERAPEPFVTAS